MATRLLVRDFNGSFYFNNGRVTTGSAIFDPTSTDFSVNIWAKFKATASSGAVQAIFAGLPGTGTGRTWLGVSAAGVLFSSLGNVTSSAATMLVLNQWYMLTLTKTGTTIKMYINGVLDGTFTVTVEAANGVLNIGESITNLSPVFGFMTDVQVYNSLLTQAQITTLYYQGTRPSTPYIWYKLNEGKGTVATDSGSSANNGTVTLGSGNWGIDIPMKTRFSMRSFGSSILNLGTTQFTYSASTDFNVTTALTMGCWIKRAKPIPSTYGILGKGRSGAGGNNYSYTLFLAGANALQMRVSKSGTTQESQIGATAQSNITDSNWHHVACSYQSVTDGTSIMTIYLDGQVVGFLNTAASPLAASTADFVIGSDITGAGHAATGTPWSGYITEPFFYNGVLTQAQIKDLLINGVNSTLVPMTDSNLYGFWTYNEGTGTTIADSSARGNNLTVNAAASWDTDVPVRARQIVRGFSGSIQLLSASTQYMTATGYNPFPASGQYSFSTWCYITDFSTTYALMGSDGTHPVHFRFSAPQTFSYARDGTGTLLAITLTKGITPQQWVHIGLVDDTVNNITKMYVNGQLVSSQAYVQAFSSSANVGNFELGRRGASNPFNGYMTETKIWSTGLTSAQMLSEFLGNPQSASLGAYWPFSDGSGTSVTDSSGNSHTGTLSGAPAWSTNIPMLARSTATGRSTV